MHGGETVADREDPHITHFVVYLPNEMEPGYPLAERDVAGGYRWQQIVRDHAKYWHCARQAADAKRNVGRNRTVVDREWIGGVLSGKIKLGEGNDEGQRGVWWVPSHT